MMVGFYVRDFLKQIVLFISLEANNFSVTFSISSVVTLLLYQAFSSLYWNLAILVIKSSRILNI